MRYVNWFGQSKKDFVPEEEALEKEKGSESAGREWGKKAPVKVFLLARSPNG